MFGYKKKQAAISKSHDKIINIFINWSFFGWLLLVISSLYYNYTEIDKIVYNMALSEAKSAVTKDILYRKWVTKQGGVYVKVSDYTQPNPFLTIPNRDLIINDSTKLTLINPAYMTRQVHELGKDLYDLKAHITSLNPIRPANKANEWETVALEKFNQGEREYASFSSIDEKKYLNYMLPFITEQGCLKCHAVQGYKVGDIRGGLSISIPYEKYQSIAYNDKSRITLTHSIVGIFGLIFIGFFKYYYKESQKFNNEITNRFKTIFENSSEPIGVSTNGIHQYVNQAYLKLFGFSINENLKGRHIFDLIAPKTRDEVAKYVYNRANNNNAPTNYQTIGLRKDGQEFIMDVRVSFYIYEEIKYTVVFLHDITEQINEQKRIIEAKEKAEKNEHLLKEAQALAKIGNWELEIKTGKLFWSDEIYKIFEIEKTNFDPDYNAFLNAIHPDDKDFVNDSYTNSIKTKTPYNIVHRLLMNDGRIKFVNEKCLTIFNDINDPLKSIGTVQDITEDIEKENALKISEEKFNKAFNNSPIAIIITRFSDSKIVDLNQAFCKVFDYKYEDVINKSTLDVNIWYDLEQRSDLFNKLKTFGRVTSFEAYGRNRNGEKIDLILSSEFITLGGENHVITLIFDITNNKRIEQDLRQTTEELEKFFDLNLDLLAIMKNNGEFIRVNREWEYILGYGINEIQNNRLIDYVHPDEYRNTLEVLKHLSEQKKVIGFVNKLLTKNNQVRWIEWKAYPSGEYFYAAARDITESIKQETQLREALSKAEESDKLKSSFLQNMSHEIRTPLNGILGFSSILKENSEMDPEEVEECIDFIVNSSNRLLGIVDNVLQISTIDTKLVNYQETKFSVKETISYFNNLFIKKAESKNLDFLATCNEELLKVQLFTDKDKLFQIITNFVNNAIKFTYFGYVKLIITNSDNELVIKVEDSGIGIKEEYFDKVFDRFWQFEAFSENKFGGNGLGLSISKGLADLLGLRIEITSEFGKGSTFSLIIPEDKVIIDSTSKEPEQENQNISIDLKGRLVLIADDEETNFKYLSKILTKEDAICEWAENGREAVSMVMGKNFDIVLMDIKMPLMDGYEATKLIKSFKPSIPIIAQTAYSLPEEMQKAKDAGCDGFLSKPINMMLLKEILSKYF